MMLKNNFSNKNIKQCHSRMFLSGIFHAHRCKIKGKIPELARVRLALSGSSTHAVAVAKQRNPFFNKQQGSKILNQVQDDLILFKTTTRAFTLIELLVVVLIIGILAAVALPQYQKAVFKTRFSEYETNLKTLGQAATICKIAKGTDCSIEELDIEIPTCNPLPQWTNCSYQTINNGINLVASAPGYPNNNPILSYYFTNETFTDGRPEIPVSATVMGITCRNSTLSVEECKTLGFTEYVIYNLYKRP